MQLIRRWTLHPLVWTIPHFCFELLDLDHPTVAFAAADIICRRPHMSHCSLNFSESTAFPPGAVALVGRPRFFFFFSPLLLPNKHHFQFVRATTDRPRHSTTKRTTTPPASASARGREGGHMHTCSSFPHSLTHSHPHSTFLRTTH